MDTDINLSNLAQHYSDEDAAQAFFEKIRWPNGIACVHCGSMKVYELQPKEGSKRSRKSLKLWKCGDCQGQFTVTVGTVFEDSHIPLHKWLLALHLLCSSKKGMSAHQLHRMLGITYKSAWFMAHRIRYAMSQPTGNMLRGIVEADETYIGGRAHGKRGRGAENKVPVFTLIERNGRARSTTVANVTGQNLKGIIRRSVDPRAVIMTDSFAAYRGLKKEFADHLTVDHGAGEYADFISKFSVEHCNYSINGV